MSQARSRIILSAALLFVSGIAGCGKEDLPPISTSAPDPAGAPRPVVGKTQAGFDAPANAE